MDDWIKQRSRRGYHTATASSGFHALHDSESGAGQEQCCGLDIRIFPRNQSIGIHMKRLFLALAVTLALSGCAKLNAAYSGLTSATITPNQVQALQLAFIASEKAATQYVLLPSCTPPDHPPVCSKDEAIEPLSKAVVSTRTAVDAVVTLQAEHPDQLGATGLYDAAKASYETMLSIMATYGVGAS